MLKVEVSQYKSNMPASEASKEENGRGAFHSDRFRVESVRAHHLDAMPEAPHLEDEASAAVSPSPPHRLSLSSILEPPTSGFKRLWSRRRSSVNPAAGQLTLSHYLTKEVLPNLDNYRLSVGGAGKLSPKVIQCPPLNWIKDNRISR